MIKDYLKVTFRNLVNQKFYTSLNILGLSIGIASCLLILLYVHNELSYDTFHEKAERVYRVGLTGKIAEREINTTTTCPPLAFTAVDEFPEVVNATRVNPYQGQQIIRQGETAIMEEKVYLADSTFFDVFTYKMLEGNPATALNEPNTLVIPEDI
ncbi:MAG: ABC transporter permease, partial [Leptolyngbya sp. SIO1D8]|nr:ABC transporter permease [Leptolyngbya sp. SIO1D8]